MPEFTGNTILFDSFLDKFCMCSFQFKCESIKTPGYFIDFVSEILLLFRCDDIVFAPFFCTG